MITTILPFSALSAIQLYDILRLRSEVFVVEQNCIFLDMDDKDQIAMHLMIYENDDLVAYTRLYNEGQYYEEASIGRVLVSPRHRHKKLGHFLMKESIEAILKLYNVNKIRIGAQCYLLKFYQSHGFSVDSEMYLEDGIEHVEMIRS